MLGAPPATRPVDPDAPVAGTLEGGSDEDERGAPILHAAAIPNTCTSCAAGIGAGDLQTVRAGAVICAGCAACAG